ncbi:hypothetical protein EVAR_53703_1 [Eumeta japonica]|uniref:Uncharacterized protein n=1 Tax=Eumeta variegata TaxID=151549 RepID=A0A4C1ZCD9_EUMVA|nr:hypothetical protein EVAR_53703_1 [Eumeta japonica]
MSSIVLLTHSNSTKISCHDSIYGIPSVHNTSIGSISNKLSISNIGGDKLGAVEALQSFLPASDPKAFKISDGNKYSVLDSGRGARGAGGGGICKKYSIFIPRGFVFCGWVRGGGGEVLSPIFTVRLLRPDLTLIRGDFCALAKDS